MKDIEEIQKLTEDLIRFESTRDKPEEIQKCLNYIKDYLGDCQDVIIKEHSTTNKDTGEIVPSLFVSFGTKNPAILLNGHIDVVPGKKNQYKPYAKNGKLYGRGAVDMKAGVATALYLFKSLAHFKPDLGLMIVSDEEIGGFHGTKYLVKQGYGGGIVIASEPTYADNPEKLNIVTKEKGGLWVEIEEKGKSAHASRPWLGENAIEKLMKTFVKIKALFPKSNDPDNWYTTVNLGTIQGGDTPNRIPDSAKMKLDIRHTENISIPEIVQKIKSVSKGIVKVITEVEILDNEQNNKDIQLLKASVSSTTKKNVNLLKEHGSSDLRFFSKKGIPAVLMGPLGANHHGDDEYVYLESVALLHKSLENFIKTKLKL